MDVWNGGVSLDGDELDDADDGGDDKDYNEVDEDEDDDDSMSERKDCYFWAGCFISAGLPDWKQMESQSFA